MIVLPERIHDAVIDALTKLAARDDLPADARMEVQVAAIVLAYSRHLSAAGTDLIRAHSGHAAALLDLLQGTLDREPSPPLHDTLAALRAEAGEIASAVHSVPALHGRFDDFLGELDGAFADALRAAPAAARALLVGEAPRIMDWQVGLNTLSQAAPVMAETAARDTAVRVGDMQALLRARFADPALQVSEWTALPGGFGKETCLFRVAGGKTEAELVMRRDADASLIKGVDCHEVKQEYPLLRAVFDLGFPVPEPLLLEAPSAVVKGPDFLIMRRVPGKVEGDVMGGAGKVPAAIQHRLAEVTAQLHRLPPLPQLGDDTRELRSELWTLRSAECVRRYITTWYGFYLDGPRMALPAIHSMYQWLLAHVPESDDRPALVHGDIGLHNLLFHEGRLTSVLDWEFAHVGDPMEDLGIIRTVMGGQLDWDDFLAAYRDAGGPRPDMRRIRYFEIWMNLRNLTVASRVLRQFSGGQLKQIRYGVFATRFIPHYVETVARLIREW